MAITYGFFNAIKQSDGTYDRTYNADQMSTYFEGLVSDGVYESVDDAMQVLAGTGMQVQVGAGRAIIDSKWIKNTAAYPLIINAAHVTLNRYTAIIIRLDLSARTIIITTKDGENATAPVKPIITNSETIKEMCLAYIYIGRGVTSISQANIEDTRPDNDVCGWVTGIVQQVDTSKLFLQWQTAYEEFYQQMQTWQQQQESAFDTWFSALTDQLQVNTYIEKYHKAINIGSKNGIFPLDMDGYTYASSDILFINVNGVVLTEGYDYILDTSKSPVEIHTNAELEAENILEITALKSKIGQA
jgi:hypothetical protein|nr:MAG TPA: Receptor Binding Protein [Bacteriophage sp.]